MSLLFKEKHFGAEKWTVDVPVTGFASLMPFFSFQRHAIEAEEQLLAKIPRVAEIQDFIRGMMVGLRLSNEVCLLSLIFIERLLKKGGVQLLTINWRPIVYTGVLVAAKYWEEYYLCNIDFVETVCMYSIQATKQMESTFLALCNYELFVSESLYDRYYKIIIEG